MKAFVACCGQRPRWPAVLATLTFLAASTAILRPAHAADPIPLASAADAVTVYLDQAKILKLPERTSTLVVGNPLIADAAVQPGGILVITGKSYGVTNLVALDRAGATLMEHQVQVQGPNDKIVVVYRGVERESYSCTPKCERRITLGDTTTYFAANLTQTGTLNTQAQGGSQK
jgi:Flp pilus assembly secretin CpaC